MAKKFYNIEFYKSNIVDKPKRNSFRDLEGMTSGNITVLNYAGKGSYGQDWWCKCSCDNTRVFKVAAQSITKGLTNSCGCLYKNNGGNIPESLDDVNSKYTHYTFTEFNGWNHPAKAICNTCKISYTFEKAYSARQNICCEDYNFRETVLDKNGYILINDNYKECISCKTKTPVGNISQLNRCVCEVGIDNPYCCYILEDRDKGRCKIGKAKHPDDRCPTIVNSAKRGNFFNLSISEVFWVSGEKAAYYLESLLHNHFSEYRECYDFDGGTEVFKVSLEQIKEYIEGLAGLMDKLKVAEIPPPKITNPYSSTDFEHQGYWYPSKTYYCRLYSIPYIRVEESLKFTSMRWYKLWRPMKDKYDTSIRCEKEYSKDWGDGLFGTIHGLARKYGHCDGTIWHRVNKLNYTMKDALSAPFDNIDNYWYINNKWYRKTEVEKTCGVSRVEVTNKIAKGVPIQYAIIPNRWVRCNYKRKIFNYNGDCYWWGDLRELLGITRAIGYVNGKFCNVKDYLECEGLLKDMDYFEEINLY